MIHQISCWKIQTLEWMNECYSVIAVFLSSIWQHGSEHKTLVFGTDLFARPNVVPPSILCLFEELFKCLTGHGVLRGAELLAEFVYVVRVDLLVQGAAEPLGLWMVQHGGHRVRHVDHTACLSCHHKQEAISCLQDQVLQLLQDKTQPHVRFSSVSIHMLWLPNILSEWLKWQS